MSNKACMKGRDFVTANVLGLAQHLLPVPQDVALLDGIIEALPSQPPVSGLDHLVIVPGHCIWTGAHPEDAENEDSWLLASYQRMRASVHIPRGLLSWIPKSPRTTLKHSSSSAKVNISPERDVRGRSKTPRSDSFQNGLFSVARFRKPTGAYPARFEQLHRRALPWPKLHFTYVGIPLGTEADERQALTNAFTPYSTDMYGCHAPLVQMVQKRAGRNFHAKAHGYHVGAPEMHELLEWSEGWHADLSWYASLRISSEPGEI
ncbi:hypothetical protein EDB85DRAFT_2155538 [Lactarius pseudohatsudake]|nr:hypothetical protein EDB85DRAFT_2155538 [Lactarius pseudohatsudake]